jgi:isopentenyldiphosphate isomerase
MSDEWFDVIDAQGRVLGRALREVCHGHPGFMHRAVHVVVTNAAGDLFLQKRSPRKDIQPGKWDTSVGGHLHSGESPHDGALRELREELGVATDQLAPAYEYIWRSAIETELITAFALRHEGPFTLDPHEISEGAFWKISDIEKSLSEDIFSEQFVQEFSRIQQFLHQGPARHA